jgi:hypothetical protein
LALQVHELVVQQGGPQVQAVQHVWQVLLVQLVEHTTVFVGTLRIENSAWQSSKVRIASLVQAGN